MSLSSRVKPEIDDTEIFLRGTNISCDAQVVSEYFNTSEFAKEQLKAYAEAVKEYNNSLEHPTAEDVEDIETVIAE